MPGCFAGCNASWPNAIQRCPARARRGVIECDIAPPNAMLSAETSPKKRLLVRKPCTRQRNLAVEGQSLQSANRGAASEAIPRPFSREPNLAIGERALQRAGSQPCGACGGRQPIDPAVQNAGLFLSDVARPFKTPVSLGLAFVSPVSSPCLVQDVSRRRGNRSKRRFPAAPRSNRRLLLPAVFKTPVRKNKDRRNERLDPQRGLQPFKTPVSRAAGEMNMSF